MLGAEDLLSCTRSGGGLKGGSFPHHREVFPGIAGSSWASSPYTGVSTRPFHLAQALHSLKALT